jgi:molybdopterin-guanine dinucleotide biosynthesis protein A
MLSGLILAGGLSSRMGQDKAQLRSCHNNLTLLERAEALLQQVAVEQTLLSSNVHPEGIKDLKPQCGPLSGIHAALDAIGKYNNKINELLVIPVDMPNLKASDLHKLIVTGREAGKACCYRACYLPLYLPVNLASNNYIQELMQEGGSFALKHLLLALDGIQIVVENQASLLNINKPQQWLDFEQQDNIQQKTLIT